MSNNTTPIPTVLFGLGTVGKGFYDLSQQAAYPYLDLRKVVVREPDKPRALPPELITHNGAALLRDPAIQLVIEVISDANAAFDIVKTALLAGKDVITANKKMVAENLPQLIHLQQKTGRTLLYEAAVCGAIPAVQTLDHYLGYNQIESFQGVFNGTSNFILTQMEAGDPYPQALEKAQQAGLAEADPTSDVEGWDAKYKLIISALHAHGRLLSLPEVAHVGISSIGAPEQALAEQQGWRIRHLALGEEGEYRVLPVFTTTAEPSFHLEGEDNLLDITASEAGPQRLQGKGAGALPTATAVLSDLERYRQGVTYQYHKLRQAAPAALAEKSRRYYLRSPKGWTPPAPITVKWEHSLADGQKQWLLEGPLSPLLPAYREEGAFLAAWPEGAPEPPPP